MDCRNLEHDISAAALRKGNDHMDYAYAGVGLAGLVQQLIQMGPMGLCNIFTRQHTAAEGEKRIENEVKDPLHPLHKTRDKYGITKEITRSASAKI